LLETMEVRANAVFQRGICHGVKRKARGQHLQVNRGLVSSESHKAATLPCFLLVQGLAAPFFRMNKAGSFSKSTRLDLPQVQMIGSQANAGIRRDAQTLRSLSRPWVQEPWSSWNTRIAHAPVTPAHPTSVFARGDIPNIVEKRIPPSNGRSKQGVTRSVLRLAHRRVMSSEPQRENFTFVAPNCRRGNRVTGIGHRALYSSILSGATEPPFLDPISRLPVSRFPLVVSK